MNFDEFAPFLHGPLDLIPLHRWDDRDPDGKERGKSPRDRDWPRRSYTKGQIEAWAMAGGNIGVRLRDVDLIIDVDTKHSDAAGRSAAELITQLESHLGIDLSAAPVVLTGSGGWHVYLKRPADDGRIRKKLPEFGGSIEFKSRGAQVLAAGCRHPNGHYYQWHRKQPVVPAPAPLLDAIRKPKLEDREPAPQIDLTTLAKCLDQLDVTEFRDYDKWRDLMFSVNAASDADPAAMEMFVNWCLGDDEYAGHESQIENMWEAAEPRADGRTARTLFWMVSEAGGVVPGSEPDYPALELPPEDAARPEATMHDDLRRNKNGKIVTDMLNIRRALELLGIKARYNDFALVQSVEMPDDCIVAGEQELCDDIALVCKSLLVSRWTWQREPSKVAILEALIVMSFESKHHPVRDWLRELEWDGEPRLRTWLIDNSDLHSSLYAQEVSRLTILSAVGRVQRPGLKWDAMVVLEGPQGADKSTTINVLGAPWSAEGLPPLRSPSDKDVIDAMRGRWIIEIDELAVTRQADQNTLKAFLSRTEDRCRLPYTTSTRNFPRQCVFIGTTNDTTYLRDLTGNRRVLPLNVGRVRVEPIRNMRDQLFAEAMVEWNEHPLTKIHLPAMLWGAAATEQEHRLAEEPWEEIIIEFLLQNAGKGFMTTNNILVNSGLAQRDKLNRNHTMKLSAIMQRLGVPKVRRGPSNLRGYLIPEEEG